MGAPSLVPMQIIYILHGHAIYHVCTVRRDVIKYLLISPVLKAICKRIAADELRHYKLFLTHLERYLDVEGLGFWGRLRVALGRIGESEDDELAFAYHAANDEAGAYDRTRATRAYARRAYAVYRRHHVERGTQGQG